VTKPWSELREELERLVFARGVTNVSHLIPAGRSTVYRIINGDTQTPCRAIQSGVERLVREYRLSKVAHQDDS